MISPQKLFSFSSYLNFFLDFLAFAGIHNPQSLCSEKNNKSIAIFNNRDIVSFMEKCCSKRTAIENEAVREAMEKNPKKPEQQLLVNQTKHFLLWFLFVLCFMFHYKSLASTDVAVNQMLIHITLAICKIRSN